jgi:hypothetical protein
MFQDRKQYQTDSSARSKKDMRGKNIRRKKAPKR